MSKFDIIRAWKDKSYRNTLSSEELALLPANPAGGIELSDDLLAGIAGGEEAATSNCTHINLTSGCCQSIYASCSSTCLGNGSCSCLCSF